MASDWSIPGAEGEAIIGNVHRPRGQVPRDGAAPPQASRATRTTASFPVLAEHLAGVGCLVHRFNFSHSGMTDEIETFERPDLFERDSYNRQIADLDTLIDAVADGTLEGAGAPLVLLGHSRGGVAVLLTAGRRARDGRPAAGAGDHARRAVDGRPVLTAARRRAARAGRAAEPVVAHGPDADGRQAVPRRADGRPRRPLPDDAPQGHRRADPGDPTAPPTRPCPTSPPTRSRSPRNTPRGRSRSPVATMYSTCRTPCPTGTCRVRSSSRCSGRSRGSCRRTEPRTRDGAHSTTRCSSAAGFVSMSGIGSSPRISSSGSSSAASSAFAAIVPSSRTSSNLHGHALRDAALLHRHAVELVARLHRALVVRDHDEVAVPSGTA